MKEIAIYQTIGSVQSEQNFIESESLKLYDKNGNVFYDEYSDISGQEYNRPYTKKSSYYYDNDSRLIKSVSSGIRAILNEVEGDGFVRAGRRDLLKQGYLVTHEVEFYKFYNPKGQVESTRTIYRTFPDPGKQSTVLKEPKEDVKEITYEYDDNGNLLCKKNSNGEIVENREYYEDGKLKLVNNNKYEKKLSYYKSGELHLQRELHPYSDYEYVMSNHTEYDKSGHVISYIETDYSGYAQVTESNLYDDNGNLLYKVKNYYKDLSCDKKFINTDKLFLYKNLLTEEDLFTGPYCRFNVTFHIEDITKYTDNKTVRTVKLRPYLPIDSNGKNINQKNGSLTRSEFGFYKEFYRMVHGLDLICFTQTTETVDNVRKTITKKSNSDKPIFELIETLDKQGNVITRTQTEYGKVTIEEEYTYDEQNFCRSVKLKDLKHNRICEKSCFYIEMGADGKWKKVE